MKDRLDEAIGAVVIFDDDEIEWTLAELDTDAAGDIRRVITKYLSSLKRTVPKPVFGDTTSIENALFNKVIDDLVMEIEEGRS